MKKYLVMISLLALASCSGDKQQKKVEIAKPVKELTLTNNKKVLQNSFPGKIAAGQTAELSFKISGILDELPIIEGQIIEKDQVLAKLDQTDHKLAYERNLAAFNEAEASFKRAEELIKDKYISQADFDNKRKAYEVSLADLNIAKTNLDYTTLKAPFSGKIAKIFVDNHQNVQVKEDIAIVHNLEYLDVKIAVPERIFTYNVAAKKINLAVRLDAYPAITFPAFIRETATQADTQTQTYEVKVRFKHPENIRVYPGMTATVESSVDLDAIDPNQNIFDIPADAIFADSEKNTFVWVINNENRLEKRQVIPMKFENNSVTIHSGLNMGETIVTTGVDFLREGQLVKPYAAK